jgi:hypothetical protein
MIDDRPEKIEACEAVGGREVRWDRIQRGTALWGELAPIVQRHTVEGLVMGEA